MSTSKPLPSLPLSHPLSTDAREHRRKVVKALLGLLNVDEVVPDDDWEDVGEKQRSIVEQVEQALDDSMDIQPLLPPTVNPSALLYAQRSLVIEETFLRECGVPMAYPRPKFKPKHSSSSSVAVSPIADRGSTSSAGSRASFIPASILGFFAKRSLSRATSSSIRDSAPRASLDSPASYTRQRRFSLLPHLGLAKEVKKREPDTYPVSTSPGVEFTPNFNDFLRTQAIPVLINSCTTEVIRYYGKGDGNLIDIVRSLTADKEWVHAGVRVRATITVIPHEPPPDAPNAASETRPTDDADPLPEASALDVVFRESSMPLNTLLSFGKFLELLIYSPRMKSFLDTDPDRLTFKVGALREVAFSVERGVLVYTMCAPRVQPNPVVPLMEETAIEEEKQQLRREIRSWWEGVAVRLDDLEEEGVHHKKKRLPRLPSEWGAEPDDLDSSSDSIHSSSSFSASSDKPDISALRETFHGKEQSLYAQLARRDDGEINVTRRAFLRAAKDAEGVLRGLNSVDGDKDEQGGDTLKAKASVDGRVKAQESVDENLDAPEIMELDDSPAPEWWSKSCHVPTSGNFVVREDDWGSIIAFSMSTPEYHASLSSDPSVAEPLLSPSISKASGSSFFAAFRPSGSGSTMSSSASSLSSTEAKASDDEFSAVISRKENPSQAGMLELLKDRGSKFGSLRIPGIKSREMRAGGSETSAPPSSWGKATFHAQTPSSDSANSFKTDANSILAELGSTENGSLFAPSECGSDDTVGPQVPPKDSASEDNTSINDPPPTPSKSTLRSALGIDKWLFPLSPTSLTPTPMLDPRPHIKYDFTVSQGPRPGDGTPSSSPPRRLKFSSTIYYASSFSMLRSKCSIPHSAFVRSLSRLEPFKAEGGKSSSGFWRSEDGRWLVKTLVSKWGVADLSVLLAMSPRYFDWVLREGGQKGGMVKFMGFYTVEVRNLDTGAGEKVDLLVMENLFWGREVERMYDLKGIQGRKVKKKEVTKEDKDNKDRDGEKLVEATASPGVLFDAEWLSGSPTLVTPKSKAVLHTAICADAKWLAESNIMDYSLLLGVDREKQEIVGGIVDTIGSYTFAKTLEYNLKANAARKPEEVTVVPPAEYQDRFVAAMGRYFTECPDMESLPDLEEGANWEIPEL